MGRSYEDRACDAVADGTWKELAWANFGKEKFFDLIHDKATDADPALDEVLQWIDYTRRSSFAAIMLSNQKVPDAAPYLVRAIEKDILNARIRPAIWRHGIDVGHPYADCLDATASKEALLSVMSGSHYKQDRDLAWEHYETLQHEPSERQFKDKLWMLLGFASRQDERVDAQISKYLELLISTASEEHMLLMFEIVHKRSASPDAFKWAHTLARFMHREIKFIWAIAELGQGEDDGLVDDLKSFRDTMLDDTMTTRVWRTALDYALVRRGELVSLEDARWVPQYVIPQRYGWPKPKGLLQLYVPCAEILLHHGTQDDLAWVASWAQSHTEEDVDSHKLRAIALRAREKLGLPTIAWNFLDEIALNQKVASGGVGVLLDLIEDETTAWIGPVLEKFRNARDRGDVTPALMARFLQYVRRYVESRTNYESKDYDGLDRLPQYMLYIACKAKKSLLEEHFGDSSSAWIQSFVFDRDVSFPHPPISEGAVTLSVQQGVKPKFSVSKVISELALSPDGKFMCAVGDNTAVVFDTGSGAPIVDFKQSGSMMCCAYDPAGERVAVGFHKGFLKVFNAKTGGVDAVLKGHEGAFMIVSGVKFSLDGKSLVSVDSDGLMIVWDLEEAKERYRHEIKGSWHAVEFLSDGTFVASYSTSSSRPGKRLVRGDVHDGVSRELKIKQMPNAIARNAQDQLAVGGEDGLSIGHFKGAKWVVDHTFELDAVTALTWLADTLWVSTKTGKLCAIDVKDATAVVVCEAPELLSVTSHGDAVYAAGKASVVLEVRGGELMPPPLQHASEVAHIFERSEGGFVTVAAHGEVIVWDQALSQGQQVSLFGDVTTGAIYTGDAVICITREGLRRVSLVDDQEDVLREDLKPKSLALWHDRLVVSEGASLVNISPLDLSTLGQEVGVKSTVSALCATSEGEFVWGSSDGRVGLVDGGDLVWQRHDNMSKHRDVALGQQVRQLVLSDKGDCLLSCVGDHVHLYAFPDVEPWASVRGHIGRQPALDASGRFLALPLSSTLEVYDLERRCLHAHLSSGAFDGDLLTSALFSQNGHLVVGTKAGRLYRVAWQD